jgi:hypothetical protein
MLFTNIETSRREGGTVSTHRYADSVEKHAQQTNKNLLSIKNSSILMILVSENILVESEWVSFFT